MKKLEYSMLLLNIVLVLCGVFMSMAITNRWSNWYALLGEHGVHLEKSERMKIDDWRTSMEAVNQVILCGGLLNVGGMAILIARKR